MSKHYEPGGSFEDELGYPPREITEAERRRAEQRYSAMSEECIRPECDCVDECAAARRFYSDCDVCGQYPGICVITVRGTETVACAHCLERGAP